MVRPYNATVPSGPFLDPATGDISVAWRAFLTLLWNRTGGSQGAPTDGWQQPLLAEATARSQADLALGNALATEVSTRSNADAVLGARLNSEIADRQAADALLVPRNQLCSLWASCDLSFLPTADPGLGHPWLDGNRLSVGLDPTVTSHLVLEDASGAWTLESGGVAADWGWG